MSETEKLLLTALVAFAAGYYICKKRAVPSSILFPSGPDGPIPFDPMGSLSYFLDPRENDPSFGNPSYS
jgi:hypothetical protein